MDEPQKSYAEWKKIKYYVILLIWNIQKANLQRRKQISGSLELRLGAGTDYKQAWE